jgi:hypothetical protein
MAGQSDLQRVTFSPGEFAVLFGKSQTWGYRQIYAGKVKTITEYGRIQIPAAEVERILATAGLYGLAKRKAPASKTELQKLAPKLEGAWTRFIRNRREQQGGQAPPQRSRAAETGRMPVKASRRNEALLRLGGQAKKKSPGR